MQLNFLLIKSISQRLAFTWLAFMCVNVFSAPLNEPIKPIPVDMKLDAKKVALGKRLFHDKQLSQDDSISCASCHDLSRGGADGKSISIGIKGRKGEINSPTVFNSGLNFRQFWNGRAATLEEQIDGPIQARHEMGSIWEGVIAKLYKDGSYPQLFRDAFGGEMSELYIKQAIAEFERSLTTPNSRFDQYLLGDSSAITDLERRGYENFKKYGCVSCHQGANVGGNMFQVFGVLHSYFEHRGTEITDADKGRYTVTGRDADLHMFKVPSLRMVAHTAPYFHDGSIPTLRQAVDVMFQFQLGREAPDQDKDEIVAFLKTLSTEYKGADYAQ